MPIYVCSPPVSARAVPCLVYAQNGCAANFGQNALFWYSIIKGLQARATFNSDCESAASTNDRAIGNLKSITWREPSFQPTIERALLLTSNTISLAIRTRKYYFSGHGPLLPCSFTVGFWFPFFKWRIRMQESCTIHIAMPVCNNVSEVDIE